MHNPVEDLTKRGGAPLGICIQKMCNTDFRFSSFEQEKCRKMQIKVVKNANKFDFLIQKRVLPRIKKSFFTFANPPIVCAVVTKKTKRALLLYILLTIKYLYGIILFAVSIYRKLIYYRQRLIKEGETHENHYENHLYNSCCIVCDHDSRERCCQNV